MRPETPREASRRRAALWGFALLALPTALAVFAPLVGKLAIGPMLAPPSLAHPFGTDESGRDLWTRVVHGASASLGVGLAATGIGVGIALVLGFAAGLGPRWLDSIIGRFTEVMYALPAMIVALLLVAVRGPGLAASVVAAVASGPRR